MNPKLRKKITESVSAVLPITLIVLLISVFLIAIDLGGISLFLTGSLLLMVGMSLFQLGSEMAMTPIGEGIGVSVSKLRFLLPSVMIIFVMGVIITVSEPDLQVLAEQVPTVPNLLLIMIVALGVGVFRFEKRDLIVILHKKCM